MSSWAGLRQPVALLYGYFEPVPDRLLDLFCEWRGTGIHHADGGEVIFVDNWVFAEQKDDGWHDIDKSDLVVLHNFTKIFKIEFRHDYHKKTIVETIMDEAIKS